MQKMIRAAALTAVSLAAFGFSGGASAAFVFSNDSGGDGTLTGTFPSFTIIGSNNGDSAGPDGLPNTAFYVQTFATSELVTFTWNYATTDTGGGVFDPAGFIHNGVETQLSVDGAPGEGSSGTWSEVVTAGDTFGWYVASVDSRFGCGELDINGGASGGTCSNSGGGGTPTIPEPGNVALMVAGLAAVGVAARRRRVG